jgi:hypothetical protein
MKTLLTVPVLIAYFGGSYLLPLAIASPRPSQAQAKVPFRSDFRYIVLSTEVRSFGDVKVRGVVVLLDEAAFSEDNLRRLFELLSKRYPDPEWMDAHVLTSLEQVQTPEEHDVYGNASIQGGFGNLIRYNDFNRAIFFRYGEKQFFRYTSNLGSGENLKTVVIKGG